MVWTCFPIIKTKSSCKAQRQGEEDRTGRKNECEDDIREWTGLEFTKSSRAVENREKWRKLVVKSSVMLKRPLLLRDR